VEGPAAELGVELCGLEHQGGALCEQCRFGGRRGKAARRRDRSASGTESGVDAWSAWRWPGAGAHACVRGAGRAQAEQEE